MLFLASTAGWGTSMNEWMNERIGACSLPGRVGQGQKDEYPQR